MTQQLFILFYKSLEIIQNKLIFAKQKSSKFAQNDIFSWRNGKRNHGNLPLYATEQTSKPNVAVDRQAKKAN